MTAASDARVEPQTAVVVECLHFAGSLGMVSEMTSPAVTLLGPAIDATLEVHEKMPIFPGDPSPKIMRTASLKNGDSVELSEMRLGCHIGTHFDAPAHFVQGGKTVDAFTADALTGRVAVLDCSSANGAVGVDDFSLRDVSRGDHVVLRTANTEAGIDGEFIEDYVHMSPDVAQKLVDRGVAMVGFDYYGLDRVDSKELPAHRILAAAQIPVVVMLDLRKIPPGEYYWMVAPMRARGVEGAPTRVFFFRAAFDTSISS